MAVIMVAIMGEGDMGTMAILVVTPVMEDMTMEEIMEIMGIMEETMEGIMLSLILFIVGLRFTKKQRKKLEGIHNP